MADTVFGDRQQTTLVPVRHVGDRGQDVEIISPGGPGGLFALAKADGIAVIPPGGIRRNEAAAVLPMT
jgi:molybdopterin biosynthesis enzyme